MKHLIHLSLFIPFLSFSQLNIGGNDPYDLVQNVLCVGNSSISNVIYTGHPDAVCYFQANLYNMPFTSGVLLTTGSKWPDNGVGPHGPNNSRSAGIDNKKTGWDRLSEVIQGPTYNAAILDFDFVPDGDSLILRYVFASEEYPEFVGTAYKDVAAILISGPGIDGVKNIALLPDSKSVSVNNVNNGNQNMTPAFPSYNIQYFISNGNGSQPPYNSSSQYLQYDGLTTPLTARAKVTPGETYHLSIVVADVGDAVYDSGLFIEAGSMTTGITQNNWIDASIFPNPTNGAFTIQLKDYNEKSSYVVTDPSGKVIAENALKQDTVIDLENHAEGVYFLILTVGEKTAVRKVIKG